MRLRKVAAANPRRRIGGGRIAKKTVFPLFLRLPVSKSKTGDPSTAGDDDRRRSLGFCLRFAGGRQQQQRRRQARTAAAASGQVFQFIVVSKVLESTLFLLLLVGGAEKITIYAPMIYTAPFIMFWMRAYPLRGQVGGGWALEIEGFWAL